MATKPIYTMDQIIGRLDSGDTWPQEIITYNADGLARTGAEIGYAEGIQPMTPQEKQMANYAFCYWDDLIAPTLQPAPGYPDANISFNYTTKLPNYFAGLTEAMDGGDPGPCDICR